MHRNRGVDGSETDGHIRICYNFLDIDSNTNTDQILDGYPDTDQMLDGYPDTDRISDIYKYDYGYISDIK
jgi:hypothetical protein